MSKEIKHYGTPQHSGRYPWGSGEDPQQRNKSFLGYVKELEKKGLSPVEIAEGVGMNTQQLRIKKSLIRAEQKKADLAEVIKLKEKGYSNVEIGKRMGKNESSIRSILNPIIIERSKVTDTIASILKDNVDKKKYIDVGLGVERHLGISRTKLKIAIAKLEDEGYRIHKFNIDQLGTSKQTNMIVLTKDDVGYGEIIKNKDKIRLTTEYSEDGGRSFLGLEPIKNVNSKRILIKYDTEGGTLKDGVIELRRGIDDISLGNAKYSQVRIGVDETHYMKGMAIHSDDLPKGIDIIYNTNKPIGTSKEKVFKEMKKDMNGIIDPDNPFGATVRQKHYIDKNGKKQLSALNIINEEGEWRDKWSKSLSSQMLSKQAPSLAKKQLGLIYDIKKEEFNEITSLTNPSIKKKLLDSFADDCDSSSVHLKSAALPRTSWHVLLPIPSMKETEVYAPNYRNGDSVVLIRYPHGGIFEIPELKVNNRQVNAKQIIGGAKDAIGIHPKVAERLSGADFDGDAVLVIPNNNKLIKTSSPLKGLINFDPKVAYEAYEGMPKIKPRTKHMKMGDISNLVTDMTIKGANVDEIARAVRHSMVIIDSEKHNLNYKQSYIDNGIASLKKKYQGSERSGASTLISKASSEQRVNVRKEKIDPNTGKKIYSYTNDSFTNKKGAPVFKTISSTKMMEVDDAFKLSSGTPMETVYANHANKLKSLANEARKVSINTPTNTASPSAKITYAKEVSSLLAHLNLALKNKPLERQAQLLANSIVLAKKANNPDMDAADLKKIKGQALAEARTRTGAKKQNIEITPKEWEAIQAKAISTSVLNQILNNTDLDKIKQLATPRSINTISESKKKQIKLMINSGYTQSEIADHLGVSISMIATVE